MEGIVKVIRHIHITTKKQSSHMSLHPQSNTLPKTTEKIDISEMMKRNNIMLIELSRQKLIVVIMVIILIIIIMIMKLQGIIIGKRIVLEMEGNQRRGKKKAESQ